MKRFGCFFLATGMLLAQNPNTAVYPTGAAADTDLLVAHDTVLPRATLNGTINNSVTSLVVSSASNFVAPSVLTIDAEQIKCNTLTSLTFSSCTRGWAGTAAASHNSGVTVYLYLTAYHTNQLAAEVKAVETLAVAASSHPTFNSGGTTTCNLSLSYVCEVDFGAGNTTLAFSNPRGSGPYLLRSCQDSVGGRTYTFPGSAIGFSQPDPGAGTTNCTEQPFSYDGTSYQGGAATVPSSTWHGLNSPEGTAPTPSSGFDTFYPDSTTHRWKMNNNNGGSVGVSSLVSSGTSALATSSISSGVCASAVTTSATGTVSTDIVSWSHNSDPTAVTGYTAATGGALRIVAYPTTDNVNFRVCNNTASSITPGAITLNWTVTR